MDRLHQHRKPEVNRNLAEFQAETVFARVGQAL
jgi:hypothetical protein